MFAEAFCDQYKNLPFLVTTAGENPKQKQIERPSGQPFHQILWVLRGEGIFSFEGKKQQLCAGYGFFCRKNVPSGYGAANGLFHTAWITFLGCDELLSAYHIEDTLVFRVPDFLSGAAKQLEEECCNTSTVLSRSSAGYRFLTEFLDALTGEEETPVSAKVSQYLENKYSEPLTLDGIAETFSEDRFSLCRLFRKETGESVMERLKKIRISKAKKFLLYSSYSVEKIGMLCGYDSPSYFGKVFKEETGRTPMQYRRK